MSTLLTIAAAIAVVVYVIGRQLAGESLRGRRVVLLPVVLVAIGIGDLGGAHMHLTGADITCLAVGAVLVAGIGLAQGRVLRLESRNGSLWAQMPVRGLWLWAALAGSRVVMTVVADSVDAKAAATGATVLLMLGINRLAQALVVVPRALAAGIPFAPEKDGKVFLADLTERAAAAFSAHR